MNSFTRVGLPILLVVGVVFGITFIRMNSPDDPEPEGPTQGPSGKTGPRTVPLRFGLLTASAQPDPPPLGLESLKHWDSVTELGAPGHFEFWCHNPHPQEVTVRVSGVNCQCAGVEVAPVDPEAYRDYWVASALAGGPLCPAPGLLAAGAHGVLASKLEWLPLLKDKAQLEQKIPAADPATGPRVAIVRLGWEGKGEVGPRTVNAVLVSRIGDGVGTVTTLEAQVTNVPAFDVIRREGPSTWVRAREVTFGELRENAAVTRTVYLVSPTRRHILFTTETSHADPCVTWTDPAPAAPDEVQALGDFLSRDGNQRRPRAVYRMDVTVRERAQATDGGRTQVRQLDLGLLDQRLTVKGVNAGAVDLQLRARVLGEIAFLGATEGRVELGTSFPADQDHTRDIGLVAERTGLDLTVGEVTPNYLKVKLEPLAPIDGRKQWRLRVTVPKNSLFGMLPENSAVVLTTAGPNPRRLRIPVRGTSYDTGGGGPRL